MAIVFEQGESLAELQKKNTIQKMEAMYRMYL